MQYSEIVINQEYSGMNPVQFGHEDCEPSYGFGPAVRSHWLLHFVVSGFGIFERDGETYHVGPGDIFVIPPYMETYYQADSEKPWYYIWVGFTTRDVLPEVFDNPVIRCPGAGEIFEEMRHCAGMESGKSAFLSGCIWKLTALLLEQGKQRIDYVEKALNCMRSEYMNGINIADIADRLNLNRIYFSTIFSKQIGMPPGRYLMNLRLERAAELMVVYGESPSTAAVSVGYPDLYHFSKMFKQHFGCSPRQYSKNMRGET